MFIIMDVNGENPNKEEALTLHCANIFNDYFGQFSRIDQYMRDQKITDRNHT